MQHCVLIARKEALFRRANPRFLSSFISSLQSCRANLDAQQHRGRATAKLRIPHSSPPILSSRILPPALSLNQTLPLSTLSAGRPEEIIDALLDPNTAPLGSLTPKDWKEAHEAISYLTEQKTKQSIKKAWKILDRLVKEAKHGSNLAITQEEFTSLLNDVTEAWNFSPGKKIDDIREAKAVLSRLDHYAPYLLPSASTYNAIIEVVQRVAYRQRKSGLFNDAVQFVQSVLERMHKEARNNPLVKPDTATYTLIMRTWAHSRLPGSLKKTEATFRQMEADGVSPDAAAFGAVIQAHMNEGDSLAMRRAEVILSHMQKLGEEGIEMVKPTAFTFNKIISGYAHRSDPKNAEATLYRMQEYFEAGNASAKPNVRSFENVIRSWAKRRDAVGAQRAEDILHHMQRQYDEGISDVKPNIECYEEVINAWAKVGDQSSIRKAEDILRLLQRQYDEGASDLKPIGCYSIVINAWAKVGGQSSIRKADEILRFVMKQSSERPGDLGIRPNSHCFIPLIAAWTQVGDSSALTYVDSYLEEMKDSGIPLTLNVYEITLKAWKKSNDLETKKHRIAVLEQEIERLKVSRDGATHMRTDSNRVKST